jgi:3-phosphoshikimate 1-carboxyvinyltransferase
VGDHQSNQEIPLQSRIAGALTGTVAIPGDKSISHRSLLLSSQVLGTTTIHGLLEGEDVINTARALRQLGVRIDCEEQEGGNRERKCRTWRVFGVGVGGLSESAGVLDMGNSGTGARLMMGIVTPYPFVTVFTGDHSLVKRPMGRVSKPLARMGAKFMGRSEGRLPLALQGTTATVPMNYRLPLPSAQVKSAIMLAALNTAGETTIIEPEATRDHTERMLRFLSFDVKQQTMDDGAIAITLAGQQKIPAQDREITVPADPSSAAFLIVAALIVDGSDLTIPNVCLNPTRTGLFTTLQEMGADITYHNRREVAGEEVADMRVRSSKLKAVTVPAERAPVMIDEYPILAAAAACAEGTTIMQGLAELRVKESDRLSAVAEGLTANGVKNHIDGDDLHVEGCNGAPPGGGTVICHYDHRIAMSFLIMGMASATPVSIDDARAIGTSFPNFTSIMNRLGAHISSAGMAQRAHYRPLTIAIDGPAASGKGTLARRISTYCGYPYLDTGSLYRMVGLKLIYNDKDPADKTAAIEAAQSISEQDFANPRLRQERVGNAASIVSAIPEVRQALLDYQRQFAAKTEGAVLDGRDIGTVVCPEADLKFFITASLEARAKRRHRELQGQGIEVVFESVLADLQERDERDSKRTVAALVPAEDAIHIDTSDMSAREVFEKILGYINEKSAQKLS